MEDSYKRPWKLRRPADLSEYILKNCQSVPYIIYEERTHKCTCTVCNKEFYDTGKTPEHNSLGLIKCPGCGKTNIVKLGRYGRKSLAEHGRILWFRRNGKATFAELDDFFIDYEFEHPLVTYRPSAQYRFTKSEQKYYYLKDETRYDLNYRRCDEVYAWVDGKSIKLRGKPSVYGYTTVKDYVYKIDEIKPGTDLEYANLDVRRFDQTYSSDSELIINYISKFLRQPAIEILDKSGFTEAAGMHVAGRSCKFINWRSKDLRKILGVDNNIIKQLRAERDQIDALESYRKYNEYHKGATVNQCMKIRYAIGYLSLNRHIIFQHFTMNKVIDYILTQDSVTINDLDDQIKLLIKLGRRIDRKSAFPEDFKTNHLELTMKSKDADNPEIKKTFRKNNIRNTGMDEPFIKDGLLIRPATAPGELYKESMELNHCVRSYVDRVAYGETTILFIRKTSEPDKPYYTLELGLDHKVVQCRGFENCSYGTEIKLFISDWLVWLKKKDKQKKAA